MGLIIMMVSIYMLGLGAMRIARRVDRQVDARYRFVSILITSFILGAGALGIWVAASYFR